MNLQQICSQCLYKNVYQVVSAGQELITLGFIPSMFQQKIGNQIDSVLMMQGAVVVNYNQQSLQIMTEILFSKEYPISPPAFYIVNPDNNKFQVNSKYHQNKRSNSESYGVIIDNLNWNSHKNLRKAIDLFKQILSHDFPLYTKQFQNQSSYQQNNFGSQNKKFNSDQVEQIIYDENKELEQAVNKEISKVKFQMNQDICEMLDEVQQLYNHNQHLLKSSVILNRINQDLDDQIQQADSSIQDLKQKNQKYSQENLRLETLKEKYMITQTPIHNQILELIAELDAIKGTFEFTDEWLKNQKDFNQYIEQVRFLAEKEFECKLLLKKCINAAK